MKRSKRQQCSPHMAQSERGGRHKWIEVLGLVLFVMAFSLASISARTSSAYAETPPLDEEPIVEPQEDRTYLKYSWNGKEVVSEECAIPEDAIEVSTIVVTNINNEDVAALQNGKTYVVSENTTCTYARTTGTVDLIICDGAKLTAKFYRINETATLNLYGQAQGTGEIIANNSWLSDTKHQGQPAIGGTDGIEWPADNPNCGHINVHGCNVTATCDRGAPAIGGANSKNKAAGDGGDITIYKGTVSATKESGNAIGGGRDAVGTSAGGSAGNVTVYGGKLIATGSGGITCGDRGQGGSVSLYGGEIIATAAGNAAAIGGTYGAGGITVKVHGGSLDASTRTTGVDGLSQPAQAIGRGGYKKNVGPSEDLGTIELGKGVTLYGSNESLDNAEPLTPSASGDYERFFFMKTRYVRPTYSVEFNSMGHGVTPDAQVVADEDKAVDPGPLSEEGWTFKGWFADESCTIPYDFDTEVTEAKTIYAGWTINKYTVSFNNNGKGVRPKSQTVDYGSRIVEPAPGTVPGWVFGGWYKDKSLATKYDFALPVKDNFELYAKWTRTPSVTMHRLYNPNSGEHFYTASDAEKAHLVVLGWRYEGTGWIAPKTSSKPVYRLYNANAGDHHYTMSAGERDALVAVGWNYEGIGWYSDDAQEVPLFRQYNPNAQAGSHNYTTSKNENDALVQLGWQAEGIGWYGMK